MGKLILAILLLTASSAFAKIEGSGTCEELAKNTPGLFQRSACHPDEYIVDEFKILDGEYKDAIMKITNPPGMVCCASKSKGTSDKAKTTKTSASQADASFDCENLFTGICRDKCESNETVAPAIQVEGIVARLECNLLTFNELEDLKKAGISLQKNGKAVLFNDPSMKTKRVCCLNKKASLMK